MKVWFDNMRNTTKNTCLENEVALLKKQLNSMLEVNTIDSEKVQYLSRKLDRLIIKYYTINNKSNECN